MSLLIENPFPGLRAFDFKEQHLFFGREKHIRDLLTKLEQFHFVAVVGTSGSGKSSLIRAGLLPAIHQGKLGEKGDSWFIASMKPGTTPLKNLTNALIENKVFGSENTTNEPALQENIYSLISESSLGLIQAVRTQLTNGKKLLILVDQFEELFRFTDDNDDNSNQEANAFARLIIDSVKQKDIPIYVVLTLRSDFLGDCVRFEGLPEAINDGHYLVPRLNKDQNKLAITGPVDYAKGKISPRLVQQVINDLGDNPDQLPVLQHALMRTWDRWMLNSDPGEPMDLRHYEMIGGMDNALSNHADEAYIELKNENQKEIIRQVFKCLTVKTGDNRGVRRPTSVQHILQITGVSLEELKEVLHPFRKSGRTFILPGEEQNLTTSTILDISHESLMRGWERLRIWVDEETESAELYARLCSGALLYKEGRAALWRDPELQLAIDWKKKNNPNEAWALQYNSHFTAAMNFLEASTNERTAENARKKKRSSMVRAAVLTFLFVVSGLTVWALLQTKTATEKSIVAEQKTEEALNQKELAEKAKEMALEASKQAMDAKSFAELQSNIAGEQKKLAEAQKTKAEEEALRAAAQEREALRQKQLAEQKSREALEQKQKAESSQSEATRLRLLSISQNIAFKSIQQKADPQLAALLAYQSYKLAVENRGNVNDAQLYNAVYAASQKIDPTFKPVVIRETEDLGALNANGSNISALLSNGNLNLYNSGSFKKSREVKLTGIPAALNTTYISENGDIAAIGTDNNIVAIYDVNNPGQARLLIGHTGLVRAVAFTNDVTTIATGGRDSSVIIWKNYQKSKTLNFNARIKSLTWNNEYSKLYIGSEDGTVTQYNVETNEKSVLTSIKNSRVQSLHCSKSGKIIVAGYSTGAIQVLNSKGNVTRTLNETGSVDFLSIDENNDLLVTATANKIIHIYHLSDLSQKPIEINSGSSINALSLSNGEFIFVACEDKTIRSYPINTSWFEKIFDSKINRNFTQDEWSTYIGSDVPYIK
jgi:WD40 repeat protein/energy-coupling factor transporter ATP-binding protein EcfA2